jgi:hypothetical protein
MKGDFSLNTKLREIVLLFFFNEPASLFPSLFFNSSPFEDACDGGLATLAYLELKNCSPLISEIA